MVKFFLYLESGIKVSDDKGDCFLVVRVVFFLIFFLGFDKMNEVKCLFNINIHFFLEVILVLIFREIYFPFVKAKVVGQH
jgi:hypothetical protein